MRNTFTGESESSCEMMMSSSSKSEIETHVLANRGELLRPEHRMTTAVVRRVHTAQLRMLLLAPDLLDERVCDGRIVDGHGDLRPEHVYLLPGPTVIDCIEFNENLRWIDVISDIAFMVMDLIHQNFETIIH